MRFDELASRAGTTAADIGRQADRPSFLRIVARRHRQTVLAGWSAAAAVVIVVIGMVWLWPASGAEAPIVAADTTSTTLATTTRAEVTTTTLIEGSPETCPITFPDEVPFTPPADISLIFEGDAWYGTPELWTFVQQEGQLWEGLPAAADGSLTQKTFWWSVDYVSTIEIPEIDVTAENLDTGLTIEASGADGGGNAEQGIFIVAGLQFPQAGCWRITASYRDASLSYVAWAEGP